MLRLRPGVYGFLRSVGVDYGRNEIFEHVENHAKTAEACRLIPEHHGHVYGPGTDIPQIIPD